MPKRLLLNVNVAWFFLSHRLELARAAHLAGFDVHVAADTASDEEIAALHKEELTFHRVRLSRAGLMPARDLGYATQLAGIVRRLRPDLIHNVTWKPILYGTAVARALKVPGILNATTGLGYAFTGGRRPSMISRLVVAALRVTLQRPDIKVIFQNADDLEGFVSAGIVKRTQAVLIRGSGVDLDVFHQTAEPPGALSVVLPARMLRTKGVVEFARAAQILRSRGIAARFLLAGKRDEENPACLGLREMESLQRETGVEWLGHVQDVAALYRSASVICLPSYREGLPKALAEACAAGRAIVTTDVPGCRDVVTEGVNGLLVRPRDVSSLADALARMLRDPDLRARLGAAGRHRAETEFDIRAIVQATLQLYRELLP